MKLLVCLLAGLLIAQAQEDFEEMRDKLPIFHSRLGELSETFKGYGGLPDTCSAVSKDCVGGGHRQAQRCINMFWAEKETDIRTCLTDDAALKAAHDAWQTASFNWHLAVDKCLKGDPAPPAQTDNAVFFLFKRDTGDSEEYDCSTVDDHTGDDYENAKACFQDFKTIKNKCKHCVKDDDGCNLYYACTGRGSDRPSDARVAGWWTHNKKLGKDKLKKIKTAKSKFMKCLGLRGEKRRRRFF